jgi:hypothetical protein
MAQHRLANARRASMTSLHEATIPFAKGKTHEAAIFV